MPAGLAHMTLSRIALDHLTSPNGQRAKALLKAQIGAYLVGCVGPDLPYMGQFDDLDIRDSFGHIADALHTENTTSLPLSGLQEARALAAGGQIDLAHAFFAFYMGYISHVIGDGFTHPFVRDRVGDYSDKTKKAHRALEMQLDVLVLDKYLGIEANGVSPQDDLTFFADCEFQKEIFESYSRYLKAYFKKDLDADRLAKLTEGMIRALDLAESKYFDWYTIPLGEMALVYINLDDIKKNEKEIRTLDRAIDADEKGIIYNSLGLDDIDVFDDIFPKFFAYMPRIIEAAYSYVFENGPDYTHLIPEINLDNGRLLTQQDMKNKPALWELA